VYFTSCDQGEITNSTIEYSSQNGMRFLSSSGVLVDNNTIANNNGSGILNNSSDINFSNCEINNNALWAINLDNVSVLDYPGNSGSGNGYDAFSLTGTVTQDLTMSSSISGFPYVITGFLTVNDAVSLTFPPGEVIKLNAGNITVNGSLYSQGTESEPIVFTSFTDDEFGGDLNKDGTQSSPARGNWRTLTINGAYANDGFAFIDHTIFRYGGANYSGETSMLYFTSCDQGEITNSTVEYSSQNGMRFLSSSGINFENNEASNNNGAGIMNNTSTIDFTACQIKNNSSHGISLNGGESMISACQISNNGQWAVYASGSVIKENNGNSGYGNFYNVFGISGSINDDMELSESLNGFPYAVIGVLTINPGSIVTIPAGEVIKSSNGIITVNGTLNANGHLKNPVVFTSFKDDEYGGDWNHDGIVGIPAPGDWHGITVNGNAGNDGIGQFDNCLFRYGGKNYSNDYANLYFDAEHPESFVKYCSFEYSLKYGLRANNSQILVRSSYFSDNVSYGIYVTGSTLPDLGQNSQTNGGFNHFVNNNAGNHQLYYSGITNLPAYYNDWGFYTAPEIDEHIFDNEESGQAGQVLFDPWFDPEDPTFFLNPDYSVDFEKIHVGGYVHFTDESTGFPTPNRWEWDFETDGDVESEAKNPYHAYGSEGLKTVCLVVSNGAYSKVLIKEDYINVGNYGAPDITAIKDVPNDQGGWVYVNFNKSEFDTSTLVTSTEYYTVQLNDGNSWFSAGYSSAYGSPTYSVVVHTPFDSTQYDPGIVNFRVIGSMDEGNYSSYEVEGYSVDNIRPTAPSGLLAGLSENTIYLNWVGIPDEDFHYFGIYRSESPDNFPAEPYTTIAGPEFNDEVGTNDFYYYKITAFDYTGNESDASNVVETYKYHDMIVEPGWTGVSTYFNPADGDLNSLFAPVMSNLILMQNQFGLFWPDQNINTLGDWNYKDGYVVKASTLSELVNIKCTRQDNKTVWLSEGWNLIPVLSPNNVNVSELFLEADIKIVKEVAGWRVFWPEFNINTLQSVNTGKAYFVYANADQSINYPILPKSGNYSGEQLEALVNITPWNDVHETPASHTIAFGQKVLSLLKAGDFIAAFDADDRCVGLLEVNGQNTALAIFGDDITTTEKDGYDAGEQICMKLYRPVGGDIFELELSYNPEMNTGNYEDYGLSQVVGLKMAATGISDLAGKNIQIYPNPSKGIFNIEGISTASSLAIFNTFGEEILSNDLIREGTIDLGHQPNGVYFVRIATSKGSFVKKLIKE
jgi:PKD repeat protein